MKIDEWKGKIKVVGFDVDGTLYQEPKELYDFFLSEVKRKIADKLDVSLIEAEKVFLKRGMSLEVIQKQ